MSKKIKKESTLSLTEQKDFIGKAMICMTLLVFLSIPLALISGLAAFLAVFLGIGGALVCHTIVTEIGEELDIREETNAAAASAQEEVRAAGKTEFKQE